MRLYVLYALAQHILSILLLSVRMCYSCFNAVGLWVCLSMLLLVMLDVVALMMLTATSAVFIVLLSVTL
jgi:hypothetical protein